nr:plasmid stabilization protein [Rhizobium sp. H4]
MTIRNLDEGLKQRLRVRAATHGRSMEGEARDILRTALATTEPVARNLADTIRARLQSVGGIRPGSRSGTRRTLTRDHSRYQRHFGTAHTRTAALH